jgi:hypothetical protein
MLVVYPPSQKASTYEASYSTADSSTSSDTPRQVVSSLDQLVTQWMSTVMVSAGSALNSFHVQLFCSRPPAIEKVQFASARPKQ